MLRLLLAGPTPLYTVHYDFDVADSHFELESVACVSLQVVIMESWVGSWFVILNSWLGNLSWG